MLAGGKVGGLCVLGAKGSPGVGTVDLLLGYVVQGHGDPQHGGQG